MDEHGQVHYKNTVVDCHRDGNVCKVVVSSLDRFEIVYVRNPREVVVDAPIRDKVAFAESLYL